MGPTSPSSSGSRARLELTSEPPWRSQRRGPEAAGPHTTLIVNDTTAKRKPMPQPTIMRVQPEEVVKTWRTNSALDGGTQLPRVSWSRAIAAPSQTKKRKSPRSWPRSRRDPWPNRLLGPPDRSCGQSGEQGSPVHQLLSSSTPMAVPPVSLVRAVRRLPTTLYHHTLQGKASRSSSSSRHVRTSSFSCWHGCPRDDGSHEVACNVVYLRQHRKFARARAQSIGDELHPRHHSNALITNFWAIQRSEKPSVRNSSAANTTAARSGA